MSRSSEWMFADWPENTLGRQAQILNTSFLRLWTLVAFKPLRKLLHTLTRRKP